MTKIIAMYLPQYHAIPENDTFWGKGFTDWVTVKKATPLYKGHIQPRVPLNNNYYDLSEKNNVLWQCELAKKYGIDGFGVYHYWFNNDTNILTKPAEILRDCNESEGLDYFLAWDNANWKRSWSNVVGNSWAPISENEKKKSGPEILIPYILGNEPDWENHYNYLKSHFSSSHYIKIENKPVFVILQYSHEIARMATYWNELAKRDGFDGVYIIYKNDNRGRVPSNSIKFNYEPVHSGWWGQQSLIERAIAKFKRTFGISNGLKTYSYDKIWRKIIFNARTSNTSIIGAFVAYDDSPRRGKNGKIVKESNPESFKRYLTELIKISDTKHVKMIFLTAWNEWGEGAILEPDEAEKYGYLNAVENAIKNARIDG